MILLAVFVPSSVETLLNNLSEADFELADVSLVLTDQKKRDAIAQDAGPLKGATPANLPARLTQVGVPQPDAAFYAENVARGQALVALNVKKETEHPAVEMFQDYNPQHLMTIP
jgi:hypothetical protein